jgi:hypothetical protein
MNQVSSKQHEFLHDETWILAWAGSVQRAGLYRGGTTEAARAAFRQAAIEWIDNHILPAYDQPVDEATHLRHLLQIQTTLTGLSSARAVLADNYRLGHAQKALNLLLKYRWCMGWIPEPPHCPIDRIVLGETTLAGSMNWTEIDRIEDYDRAIAAVRACATATGQSIACWELSIFARRRGRATPAATA